ncbi:Putative vacuolating cytotoxin (VacA)-like protein FaaA1 [Helicobacter sp. NHP19-003]|uniref:Vacuolating cytotoxin (VacA)-like protein FaaA1 n=1 Tax=Helicobacter gastrocanis TaxID=2849641 RepID=A0ABN6I3Y9_9HELI|nr:Putative vacuolating cytotoxin (VacA)-like protein FaaA1 [Helicobacter sp. NHP19-003]
MVGAMASYNGLAAYDLGNQTHIVGYMWDHRNGEFYYGGGGYYCGSYWCNDAASLTSNKDGDYLLSQLTWKGGSLNIGLNNATLNVGTQGSNTFTNYYDTATFNDTINARNINLAQTLNLERDTNLSISASQNINANNATLNSNGYTLALKGQNGNFNDTSLNGGSAINIDVSNLTLNNVSFNDANTSVTNTGSLNIQNTITLTHNSPLTKLASTITLSPSAIFNITQDLSNVSQTGGSSYSVLNTTGNINTSSYGKALWNLIRYHNQSASLYSGDGASEIQSNGETIYHVAFNEGGKQYTFGEAFGPKSISIFSLQPTNVWGTGVLPLNGSHDFSVGPGGVAYINPNAANPTNGYKILNTNANAGPASFGVNIKGSDSTLILGNDTANPINWQTSKAAISIGGDTHTAGTIKGAFSAYNIYMTNTLQTGNNLAPNAHNILTAQYGGHGTTITFNASNNLTMDDLRYWERIAGDEQSSATFNATNNINVSNSTFIDNTRSISAIIGGDMKFSAQNTTFNNSRFSGDQNQISLTGTQKLTLTDTQINNGMSTVSLNAGTLNMDCDGKNGSCVPNFSKTPPFGASGFSGINAEHLLVNAQTATFSNTTLNIDPVSGANAAFSTNNLTFNNTTFSGDNTFSFKAYNKGGQVTTFEGTTTLDTAQSNQALSPFATALSGQVILGSNAVFNIQNTLNNPAKTYTILDTQNAIQASSQDYLNTYAGRLWQLIHYQGQSASSAQQVTGAFIFNNQVYNIPTADKAYMVSFGTARFLETFGNNRMALQYVSQAADVWQSVYPMQNEPNVPQSYNVGVNGVAFIDPAHNHSDPGYNPGDNSLSANSQVSGGATDTTIVGNNATLVIGNDQLQAIGLKAQRASVNLDPSEKTGNSSSTTLSAPNVLLTNDLNIGSNKGGSGDLNISAQNTMTMDGLDFNATGSQQTNQNTFTGTQSLNIQNSNLNANGGALSLNSQNIQLNHANLTGQSGATITLNASSQSSNTPTQINAANTDFKDSGGSVKLNAQNITLGTSTQGTLYDKSVSGAARGAVRFSGNNTAISIAATGALDVANTSFNEQNGGSISLSSGQNLTIGPTLTFSGNATHITLNTANTLNITGQAGQEGFNDTNGAIQLQGQNIKLNAATFAGSGNSVKILGAGGVGPLTA